VVFEKSDFLLKYHQNSQVLKRWSIEKKLQGSQIKEEVNILRGEKHFNFKDTFLCDSIFSPSIIPFQKLFPKSLRVFLALFGPSFSLGIYMT
jgi:hypothetical protein